MPFLRLTASACIFAFLVSISLRTAEARVQLESICSVYGQKQIHLTGIGLVVGLSGTGDGAAAGPSVNALKRAMERMGQPVLDADIRDASNVAIVVLEATVPAEGVHIGQTIDVYCSSIFDAEDIRHGRLLTAPLMLADQRSQAVVALARGDIVVDNPNIATGGRITNGASIEADLFDEEQFITNVFHDNPDPDRGKTFKLLLNPTHAGFSTASTVSNAINADFRDVDLYGRTAARAVGPGTIEVTVPPQYSDDPVAFLAEVLEIGIDRPHSQARVIVNNQTGTVIITGEASLDPVLISHGSIQVEVGSSFRTLVDPNDTTNNAQLNQLVGALGQLQVPSRDVIEIVRDLNSSGKLHAVYLER